MINENKWIDSLKKDNLKKDFEISQIDGERWVNTIKPPIQTSPLKKNTFNSVKKYTFLGVLFFCGLLLVSAIKNETRSLQKEINHLKASINDTKFNLSQALLDHAVITSPENISSLAKEYLDTELVSYKKNQIKDSNYKQKTSKNNTTKNKGLVKDIKNHVASKIKNKKNEIKKLKKIYSNPKALGGEIKTQVSQKKAELENIYKSPKDAFTMQRAQKWAAVQLVKAFLGMPIIPGR